ncbi:hypothetical protein OR1_02994 [Geobacter sp. OR-1]|uniref:ATP-binding protein n=1 Tax=Geobacter sp. OR-1 TaxID=1266765 RepID=UPI000542A646|nr:ATP-binding protein [Geobacter sp. OR-1]GAM10701.1 hypothetical protein OR1_02994 [Geobacter sp. OR-1]
MPERWETVLSRLESVLDRADRLLTGLVTDPAVDPAMFERFIAFRWERAASGGNLAPVAHPHLLDLDDLIGIDYVKEELVRNTSQFVAGRAANNVLLWGERGNGKSSCIKGLLNRFAPQGLRLVELQRWDLLSLPLITGLLRSQPYRFILFCDDLSFGEGEVDYRSLKTLLDGGIEERPDNMLIYATSNRRHLMPELTSDNSGSAEIHPEEAISEKLSLADRFGLSLGFTAFDQQTYLAIVANYAGQLDIPLASGELRRRALLWAMESGRRSGRSARQFIADLSGRLS